MKISYHENMLTAEQLAFFRNQAGWGNTSITQAEKAIQNTLFSVVAMEDNKTVGIGRLVGDGSLFWYIQDLIVLPTFQGKSIGTSLMERLVSHAVNNGIENSITTIGLMSAKGKELFYQKFGFHSRPNDREGAGMIVKKKVPPKS